MSKPEIREFNLISEIERLQKILLLPITNVIFDERYEYGKLYLNANQELEIIYAKLYVGESFVGTMPYMSDKWGPMYVTSKQNQLDWNKIYEYNKTEILKKVNDLQPLAGAVEVGDFRSLNVKDKNGVLINVAYCTFLNGNWNIVLGDPNPKIMHFSKTFTLPVPPPSLESDE